MALSTAMIYCYIGARIDPWMRWKNVVMAHVPGLQCPSPLLAALAEQMDDAWCMSCLAAGEAMWHHVIIILFETEMPAEHGASNQLPSRWLDWADGKPDRERDRRRYCPTVLGGSPWACPEICVEGARAGSKFKMVRSLLRTATDIKSTCLLNHSLPYPTALEISRDRLSVWPSSAAVLCLQHSSS